MKERVILAFQDNHKEMLSAKESGDFENYHECKGYENALLFVLGLYGISYSEALRTSRVRSKKSHMSLNSKCKET